MLDLLAQTGVNALYAASYISLIAVGLVLIFGVMGVINFAHGELFMAGAYASSRSMPMPVSRFCSRSRSAWSSSACWGLAMEQALFRPLRDNPLGGLVASIGFLMILQALAVMGFGVRMEHIPPVTQDGHRILRDRYVCRCPAVRHDRRGRYLLGALWYFLKQTRFGWALAASAQDAEAAALQGISINQTARIAMFIGAALAGVAGALTAPLVSVNPHMGHSVIVTAFIVIIVGGVGSLEGAIIASVAYAFVHTIVTTFCDGVIADIVGLSLMLLVLIVKPTGLFGAADRA